LSFDEERFEDTLELIDDGYNKISELESSQTAVNAVYSATSRTLKNFFREHGLKIAIFISIALFFLLIFWNTLKIWMRKKY